MTVKLRHTLKATYRLRVFEKSAVEDFVTKEENAGKNHIIRRLIYVVRFQVLTAASMMFRAVFWVIQSFYTAV
jgi:hypothetical protein